MVDLMASYPKNFHLPTMQGSYSIKYVLPILVPDLSYDSLIIGNNSEASSAFLKYLKEEIEKELISEYEKKLPDLKNFISSSKMTDVFKVNFSSKCCVPTGSSPA